MISGSSLHMKIQIMARKITENLGFKFFALFSFHFQILQKKLHIFLTIFECLVIWKWTEKGTKNFWPPGAGIWTPDFQ